MSAHKLRIFVFFSGGASGLKFLMENDSNLNKTYQIVGCFCDDKSAKGIDMYQNVTVVDYKDWRIKNQLKANLQTREKYFAEEVAPILADKNIDLIILSGFMKIIPETFLNIYPRRIINIHPADLSIKDSVTGKPKYKGDDAVRLAMEDGALTTASTIHFAEKETDEGEIIGISEGLPVVPERDAKQQQERMKKECDGPALAYALTLIAQGIIKIGK